MAVRSDLDRSTMFTILLDVSPKFGAMSTAQGRHVVTEALAAWDDSTAVDMYRFTVEWINKEQRKDLLPLTAKA